MALGKMDDAGFLDRVSVAISEGVRQKVEEQYDEYKNKLIERIDRDKDIVCAGIVLNVMSFVQVRDLRTHIEISIKKIDAEKAVQS